MTSPHRRVGIGLVAFLLTAAAFGQVATTAHAKEPVPPSPSNPGVGVTAWGSNAKGESEVPTDARAGVQDIAAGNGFSMALKDGRVISWGDVGCKSWSGDINQVAQPELDGVDAITAKDCQAMALRDGEVIAWGSAYMNPALYLPAEVKSGVTAIATSHTVSLAVKDGRVISWGGGTIDQQTVPVEAQTGVKDVATDQGFSMALKDSGQVITWGRGGGDPLIPVPYEAQSGVTAIATNGYQAMALKDGGVIIWGDTRDGLGVIPVQAQSGVTAIAASGGNWGTINPDFTSPMTPGGVFHAISAGQAIGWGIAYPSSQSVINPPSALPQPATQLATSDSHGLVLVPPTMIVCTKAIRGRSRLHVNVNPNKGKGYWKFQVQRQQSDGTWTPLKTYRTKGSKETRTINLKKGTYRVAVGAKYGYAEATSGPVYLKR